MPDFYSERLAFDFSLSGTLAVAAFSTRRIVPFDFTVFGATASVGTAPTGASLIFDVVVGPAQTADGGLVTLWPKNPSNRPTILAGNLDQAAIAASTFQVAPEGTDPDLQGQTTGVSTTYQTPNPYPWLAKPDNNQDSPTSPVGFGGNTPFYEPGVDSPVDLSTNLGADVEAAGAAQAPEALTSYYVGTAGSVLNVTVLQVGSTVAGANALVTVYIQPN